MKKLIMWFIGLFKRSRKNEVKTTYYPPEGVSKEKVHKPRPSTNNRRRTSGRILQVINMGKTSRVIHHEAA